MTLAMATGGMVSWKREKFGIWQDLHFSWWRSHNHWPFRSASFPALTFHCRRVARREWSRTWTRRYRCSYCYTRHQSSKYRSIVLNDGSAYPDPQEISGSLRILNSGLGIHRSGPVRNIYGSGPLVGIISAITVHGANVDERPKWQKVPIE